MQRSAIVELEENALILEFATVGTFSRFRITLAATLFSSIPLCVREWLYISQMALRRGLPWRSITISWLMMMPSLRLRRAQVKLHSNYIVSLDVTVTDSLAVPP